MFRDFWNFLCWFARTIFTDAGLTEGYINGSSTVVTLIMNRIIAVSVYDMGTALYMDAAISAGMVVGMGLSGRYTDWTSSKMMIFMGTSTTACFSVVCAFISLLSIKNNAQLLMLKILFAVFRSGLGFGLGIEFVGNFIMDSDNAYHLIRGREWRSLLYSDTLQYNLGVLLSNFIPFVLFSVYGIKHHMWILRVCLAIGAILPLHTWICHVIACFTKARETGAHHRMRIARTQIPSSLFHEFYSPFLWSIGIAWLLYEISAAGLSLYVTAEFRILNGNVDPNLWRMFGWMCLINLFRCSAAPLRSWGPKKTLIAGTAVQCVLGLVICTTVGTLIRTSLSPILMVFFAFFHLAQEFGAGSSMALLAVTSCAPSVRGRYLGFAAAISKMGSIAGDTLIYLMWEYLEAKNMATALVYYGLPDIMGTFNIDRRQAWNNFLNNQGYPTRALDQFELPPPTPVPAQGAISHTRSPSAPVPRASPHPPTTNRPRASTSASTSATATNSIPLPTHHSGLGPTSPPRATASGRDRSHGTLPRAAASQLTRRQAHRSETDAGLEPQTPWNSGSG
ncbi:hypothetical protein D6C97_09267 [Aureobasidium pullulans]|uniref:MFS general substrate transporter n=1 Tax=Aureobasidium pullulans TaxID=5580 RepID=A0AB74JFK1_AURPU|nr:hypothetical protein D6D12_10218 [Aureobasidium pullulans]THY43380.1 hypothetical protein D6C97_09267 [Aureobasidium pullulans]